MTVQHPVHGHMIPGICRTDLPQTHERSGLQHPAVAVYYPRVYGTLQLRAGYSMLRRCVQHLQPRSFDVMWQQCNLLVLHMHVAFVSHANAHGFGNPSFCYKSQSYDLVCYKQSETRNQRCRVTPKSARHQWCLPHHNNQPLSPPPCLLHAMQACLVARAACAKTLSASSTAAMGPEDEVCSLQGNCSKPKAGLCQSMTNTWYSYRCTSVPDMLMHTQLCFYLLQTVCTFVMLLIGSWPSPDT